MKLTSNYAWKKTESALQSSRPTLAVTPGNRPVLVPKRSGCVGGQRILVLVADCEMLAARARTALRSSDIGFIPFAADVEPDPHQVMVLHVPGAADARPGELNTLHAPYVLRTLDAALQGCLSGQFAALVTGPVHKGVINDAGIAFSGHTEYLTEHASGVPIMMLATPDLRVALATTHRARGPGSDYEGACARGGACRARTSCAEAYLPRAFRCVVLTLMREKVGTWAWKTMRRLCRLSQPHAPMALMWTGRGQLIRRLVPRVEPPTTRPSRCITTRGSRS